MDLAGLGSDAAAVRITDLCFVLDCTSSMGKWIEEAKNKVREVYGAMGGALRTVYGEAGSTYPLRVALVAYRDFDHGKGDVADPTCNVCAFTEDVAVVGAMLRGEKLRAGTDFAEDVAGGLDAALSLEWKGKNRIIVLITDAPPHGLEYHDPDISDKYASEKPPPGYTRRPLADIVRDIARKRIDLYFVHVRDPDTKRDYTVKAATRIGQIFRGERYTGELARGRQPEFVETALNTDPTQLMALARDAVMATASRNKGVFAAVASFVMRPPSPPPPHA